MKFDLSSLERAVASLARALDRSRDAPADEELRDAVIQRFEYTYELCWKMLKRRVEHDHPSPEVVDRMSFRDLLREARERGLIENVEPWLTYREMRNVTSHTYDPVAASEVHSAASPFLASAQALLATLEARNVD